LRRDVLPGYRDVDADAVDLEAWFADRDVQAFVERLERVQGRRLPEPVETWSPTDPYPAFPLDPDGTLPLAIPSPPNASPSAESDRGAEVNGEAPPSWRERLPLDRFSPARFQVGRPWLVGSVVFVLLVAVAAAFALVGLRRESELESPPTPPPSTPVQARLKPEADPAPASLKPLEADAPSEAQLQTLLQAWLDRKASVLAGGSQADAQLETVARDGLIQQLEAERQADAATGARQTVKATITSVEVVSRSPQRIELRARVAYSDQRLDADGKVIDRTPPTTLPVTYILGRDGRDWRLHAYITG
jgi:hypothetical protein